MKIQTLARACALMLGLSLGGGLATTAHAAPGAKDGKAGKNGMRGGGMKVMKELNLTDAQKAKLKPIMQAQRDKMMAMRADTTTDRKAKMAKMKAMRAETEKKVNAILTPAQQKQLADIKAKMKAERKDGAGKNGERKNGKRAGRGPQAPAPTV